MVGSPWELGPWGLSWVSLLWVQLDLGAGWCVLVDIKAKAGAPACGLGGHHLGIPPGLWPPYLSPPLSWGLGQFTSQTCTSTPEVLEVPRLTRMLTCPLHPTATSSCPQPSPTYLSSPSIALQQGRPPSFSFASLDQSPDGSP